MTPLVVLLHPLPLGPEAWDDVRRHLRTASTAPELYRHGPSLRGWAVAVLGRLPPRRPLVVVGSSVGGSCALEVARLAPRRVQGLALLGTKAAVSPDPALRDAALDVLLHEGVEAAWDRWWAPLLGPAAGADVRARARELALSQPPDLLADGVRAFHDRDDAELFLRSWPAPVLLVDGEHDLAPERTRRLAPELAQGSFRLLPGAGHYGLLERPREVAAVVQELVQQVVDGLSA